MQFKVVTKKADINEHLEGINQEIEIETDESCIALQKDNKEMIQQISYREAIT